MRFDWLWRESANIIHLFWWHLGLSVIPVIVALILALPLGWLAHRSGVFKALILGTAGLLYTIPSLALFVLLPLLLQTKILDPLNVVVALTTDTLQAATAMGYRPIQRFFQVELPIAVPVVAAGLRVALVSNVSVVSVAALIGTPQLGLLFTQGLQLRFVTPLIAGIVLCLVLAIILDGVVIMANRWMTPWQQGRV